MPVDLQKIQVEVLNHINKQYENSDPNDGVLGMMKLIETTALETTILVLQKIQDELENE